MTDTQEEMRAIFMQVHSQLPQEAPGSAASTARAFHELRLRPDARILDVGCGPGRHTLTLAELAPEAEICGVDLNPGFIQEAMYQAERAGLDSERVTFAQADMHALDFPDGSFDAIWCEGAAYIIGVAFALTQWQNLLRENGFLVYTDAVFLNNKPHPDVVEFWASAYPDMVSVEERCQQAADIGYRVINHFVLPESDWWAYYTPLEARIEEVRHKLPDTEISRTTLDLCQAEIDLYRSHSSDYGYACFCLQNET